MSFGLWFLWLGIVWCWWSISCFRLLASLRTWALHKVHNLMKSGSPFYKRKLKTLIEAITNNQPSLHQLLLHHIIPILPIIKKPSNFHNQIIRIIINYHIVNNIIIHINTIIRIPALPDRMIWFKRFRQRKSLHNGRLYLIQ